MGYLLFTLALLAIFYLIELLVWLNNKFFK